MDARHGDVLSAECCFAAAHPVHGLPRLAPASPDPSKRSVSLKSNRPRLYSCSNQPVCATAEGLEQRGLCRLLAGWDALHGAPRCLTELWDVWVLCVWGRGSCVSGACGSCVSEAMGPASPGSWVLRVQGVWVLRVWGMWVLQVRGHVPSSSQGCAHKPSAVTADSDGAFRCAQPQGIPQAVP